MFRSLRFWIIALLVVTWGALLIAVIRGHDWQDALWWAAIATLCLSGFTLAPRPASAVNSSPAPGSSADDVSLLLAGVAASDSSGRHHPNADSHHDGAVHGGDSSGEDSGGGDGGGGD